MTDKASLTAKIIARAQSYPHIRAGIASLEEVLKGPSYRATPEGEWASIMKDEAAALQWLPGARSLLVLGLEHPAGDPRLDWWDRGNTAGNRRLIEISKSLRDWLRKEHGREAQPLPYHVERGGVFLKDAAVFAGLGIVGRSNLFLHPQWGPRIRLRSILIEGELEPTEPVEGFDPCEGCEGFCQKACPQEAFPEGVYSRPRCLVQLDADKENKVPGGEYDENGHPIPVVKYCRDCELACPAGKKPSS